MKLLITLAIFFSAFNSYAVNQHRLADEVEYASDDVRHSRLSERNALDVCDDIKDIDKALNTWSNLDCRDRRGYVISERTLSRYLLDLADDIRYSSRIDFWQESRILKKLDDIYDIIDRRRRGGGSDTCRDVETTIDLPIREQVLSTDENKNLELKAELIRSGHNPNDLHIITASFHLRSGHASNVRLFFGQRLVGSVRQQLDRNNYTWVTLRNENNIKSNSNDKWNVYVNYGGAWINRVRLKVAQSCR